MSKPKCNIVDCPNVMRANTFCRAHNMRNWRYGDPLGGTNGKTHGMTNTREYWIWAQMKNRCLNPRDKSYYRYGARGIGVCNRWLKFENFYEDMGSRPSEAHSLERIDNNGSYSPDNCKWALGDIQMHNRRPYNKLGIKNIDITPYGKYRVLMSRKGTVLKGVCTTLEEAIKMRNKMEKKLYVTK